jgi:hypothetical protein
MVNAEVEIRELYHPHHPLRRAGDLHHLHPVISNGLRGDCRGEEEQGKLEEPLAAHLHGRRGTGEEQRGRKRLQYYRVLFCKIPVPIAILRFYNLPHAAVGGMVQHMYWLHVSIKLIDACHSNHVQY